MSVPTTSYECPLHKTQYSGLQRPHFDRDVFDALLLANMFAAMRVYKEVKQGCHCPTNYAAFDRIVAEEDSLNDFRQQSNKDANKHTGAR
jgi:hypothetical protein